MFFHIIRVIFERMIGMIVIVLQVVIVLYGYFNIVAMNIIRSCSLFAVVVFLNTVSNLVTFVESEIERLQN